MPHDWKGNMIQPGDQVTMTFVVVSVSPNEECCNTHLRALSPTGEEGYKPEIACNTRLTSRLFEPMPEPA